jgi:hypothetical protein
VIPFLETLPFALKIISKEMERAVSRWSVQLPKGRATNQLVATLLALNSRFSSLLLPAPMHAKKNMEDNSESVTHELERIRKYCTVVRVLAHTQIHTTGLFQKKAH